MERSQKLCAVLVGLLIASGAGAVWSQCSSCKWADRGNRFEGIVEQQNSGGCCAILGVHYKGSGQLTAHSSSLTLYFWLAAEASPKISVWQPEWHYLMSPKDQRLGPGLRQFSWPRGEVLERLGIQPESLYLRVVGPGKVFYPALLSTQDRPSALGGYAFVLESGDPFQVICTIERAVGGVFVPIRSFPLAEKFGGIFTIEWDGRDAHGQQVQAGIYTLHLKGSLEAEKVRHLDFTLSFQHYDKFL